MSQPDYLTVKNANKLPKINFKNEALNENATTLRRIASKVSVLEGKTPKNTDR